MVSYCVNMKKWLGCVCYFFHPRRRKLTQTDCLDSRKSDNCKQFTCSLYVYKIWIISSLTTCTIFRAENILQLDNYLFSLLTFSSVHVQDDSYILSYHSNYYQYVFQSCQTGDDVTRLKQLFIDRMLANEDMAEFCRIYPEGCSGENVEFRCDSDQKDSVWHYRLLWCAYNVMTSLTITPCQFYW